MARLVAEYAEVARRTDQTLSEVQGPDAIDDDARGQRIAAIDDGRRQVGATATVFEGLGLTTRQNPQEPPAHERALR